MFVYTLRTELWTLRDGGRGRQRERQKVKAPLACSLSEQREHIVKTTFTNPAGLKLKTQSAVGERMEDEKMRDEEEKKLKWETMFYVGERVLKTGVFIRKENSARE